MKINIPLSVYTGHSLGFLTNVDIIEWGVSYLMANAQYSEDSDLIDLVSLSTRIQSETDRAGECLKQFIGKHWPDFDLKGSEAETYAIEYFRERLRKYLDGQCAPYDVCKMISLIEDSYDFPLWLGDMYNACDWIEPYTRPADCPHLGPEIEKTLAIEMRPG